jgi:predicted short-subunit dehydrogenase-like oxidoreductase (DUF2520 family)
MDVSFIGSGNLAWHLAPALDNTDYAVKEVYSPNPKHAQALAERLYRAEIKESLDFSSSSSMLFIIAVADDAIRDVAREIVLPEDALLVHTSGSQPLSALEYAATARIGVFYPLQTFTKSKRVDFSEVPVFVESEDPETEAVLMKMGKAISRKVLNISSAQRSALHVAAVFAANFTNHMIAISADLMRRSKLDFEWLKPLIAEMINKSLTIGPGEAQTGPARRGDLETLDRHVEFLQGDEALAEIYKIVSQHIIDRYEDEGQP